MQDYLSSIISIREKDSSNCIKYNKLSIESIIAKYSNTKQPINKLVIDDKPISRNNNLIVKYQCLTCKATQEITLNLFVRKTNTNGKHCHLCVNTDENKRQQHSEFMYKESKNIISGSYSNNTSPKKLASLKDTLEVSDVSFNDEDDQFKNEYFLKHLSLEEFNRIQKHIISIGNGKTLLSDNWSYYPYYRISNQTRYIPVLVNITDNIIDKLKYIKFECENCNSHFINRDIEVQKNRLKILCQDCSFTNRTFQIKHYFLKSGAKILWQSIPERRFIEWCDENSICIKNGPSIEYEFNNKLHKYKVDFELPNNNILLEIKDNHIWHKQQVESGKFNKKVECAKKWCQTNNYRYIVAFPKLMSKLKEYLLKKTVILEDIV
jgi:hypothetical protein